MSVVKCMCKCITSSSCVKVLFSIFLYCALFLVLSFSPEVWFFNLSCVLMLWHFIYFYIYYINGAEHLSFHHVSRIVLFIDILTLSHFTPRVLCLWRCIVFPNLAVMLCLVSGYMCQSIIVPFPILYHIFPYIDTNFIFWKLWLPSLVSITLYCCI